MHVKGSGFQAVPRGGVHGGGLGVHGAPVGVQSRYSPREGRRTPCAIAGALAAGGGEGTRSLLGEHSGWEDRSCSLIFGE